MDLPAVDALLELFGPFLFPVALFVAGAIGYGVLLLANGRLDRGPVEWPTESSGTGDDADADRTEN